MYRIEMIEKKAIALAFFSCGCNQSQIFPRSGCKVNILYDIIKRVFGIYFSLTKNFQHSTVQVDRFINLLVCYFYR
jgi:hypothetical protein